MGMEDNNGLPLVEHSEKRIQLRSTQILASDIRCQLDAVGSQCVECILCLTDGSIDIRQRQGSAEQEPVGMFALDEGSSLVRFPHYVSRSRLWSSQRQHRGLHSGFVHPLQMIINVVFRQRESFVEQSAFFLQSRHKLRSDDVAMHIYHTLSKCGCS